METLNDVLLQNRCDYYNVCLEHDCPCALDSKEFDPVLYNKLQEDYYNDLKSLGFINSIDSSIIDEDYCDDENDDREEDNYIDFYISNNEIKVGDSVGFYPYDSYDMIEGKVIGIVDKILFIVCYNGRLYKVDELDILK